jgi:hypothetical protein
MASKIKLTKTVYARITSQDFADLTDLADERQQSISQVIRKALIDAKILNR